jgi:hypothetical protein
MIRWTRGYIRESCADGVIEEHLTQKPGRNVGLLRLADDEAVVEEGISDVADQWDKRYRSAVRSERRAVIRAGLEGRRG